MDMDPEHLVACLKSLGDRSRLQIVRILSHLKEEEQVTCSSVLAQMGVSQSTFSHHVSDLVDAGIVNSKPNGRTNLLNLNRSKLAEISRALNFSEMDAMG